MKKIIELDMYKVEVRGAKYKEVKELIRNSKVFIGKAKEVGEKISLRDEENQTESNSWQDEIIDFLIENMDEVIRLIAQFTNLSKEQIEDMEVPELMTLIDHILKVNRINIKKIYDFFSKLWKELGTKDVPVKKFIQTI